MKAGWAPESPFRSQKTMSPLPLRCLAVIFCSTALVTAGEPEDAAYIKTTSDRAQKIVAKLGISDDAQAVRVRDIIAKQYRDLSALHARRDAARVITKAASGSASTGRDAADGDTETALELEQFRLHAAFVGRLSAELTAPQVDQVKDGLTFNVVPITFQRYQELLPDLTAEQKLEIHALLLEAREHAMDAGSSEAKHAVFGKYKGRINNRLSSAGFDLKAAERALQERERSRKNAS